VRDDRQRLLDILEAIDKIEGRLPAGRAQFLQDELIQVWVVHHIQRIGEAAAALSEPLRERHPRIPWRDIVAMRNVLVHQYFGVDLDEVWDTAVADLPSLRRDIEATLREEPPAT